MTQNDSFQGRRVVANISLSLDGRVTGRGGDYDMGWVVPHAVSDATRELLVRMTNSATTVLLGRKNYEGFGGYWPTVARDENADPRDRSFARWLDSVEKVAFSTTLTEAPWENSRIVDGDPVEEAKRLRERPGGDIQILSSGSLIRAFLAADELDRMIVTLCPELVGGGARLFQEDVPLSSWSLTDLSTTDTGAVCLIYDRLRKEG